MSGVTFHLSFYLNDRGSLLWTDFHSPSLSPVLPENSKLNFLDLNLYGQAKSLITRENIFFAHFCGNKSADSFTSKVNV